MYCIGLQHSNDPYRTRDTLPPLQTGTFATTHDTFVALNPSAQSAARALCWHSRRGFPVLTSVDDAQALAQQLQQLQDTYFNKFVRGFNVWVDILTPQVAEELAVGFGATLPSSEEDGEVDKSLCPTLGISPDNEPKLQFGKCSERNLAVCTDPKVEQGAVGGMALWMGQKVMVVMRSRVGFCCMSSCCCTLSVRSYV